MTCHCGVEMAAPDTAALVEPVHHHFTESHSEFGLTPVAVRNYLDAEDRATGGTERLETIGEVTVGEIGPDRADEIISFFDHDAFSDFPAWASCYCMFYFLGGGENPDWGNQPWQDVRQAQHDRISAGRTTGVVAYVDGRLAGWCNATSRSEFPSHRKGDDGEVCSVVCFIVAPPYRAHGLAGRMLEGAVDMARKRGFAFIEGYPVRDAKSAQGAYHGTFELFQEQGFVIASEEPLTVQLAL